MSEIKISGINNTDYILLKNFLNSTLKEIMSVINAECGSLFLFDSENKELILDSFYNSGTLHLEGLKQRIGEGVSGKVISIKTPILVKDINKDSRFRHNGFTHYKTNSFISIRGRLSNKRLRSLSSNVIREKTPILPW